MRITHQPSGGRGEYELIGISEGPLSFGRIENKSIRVKVGSYTINTRVAATKSQGKSRLRRLDANPNYPQIQAQVAAALMLPKSVRSNEKAEAGLPVIRANGYVIKDIVLQDLILSGRDEITVTATLVQCENQSGRADEIVGNRVSLIESCWKNNQFFPIEISELLQQHEMYVRRGTPVPNACATIVQKIQDSLSSFSVDLGVVYTSGEDSLPVLYDLSRHNQASQPDDVDQMQSEDREIRARVRRRWQVYASSRGAQSVRFSRDVKRAYKNRCAICGVQYPSTPLNRRPGVDAAHILPWSLYDLDQITNGLCLCKTHHWAFDEGLLRMKPESSGYSIALVESAAIEISPSLFSIDKLQAVTGMVNPEWLPDSRAEWPAHAFLMRLNEELSR